MKLSINLSTIFTEVPFLERFQKAKEFGFHYVECQFPYEEEPEKLLEALQRNELSLELMNLPPGDWENGDRGLAVDPNRVEEFRASLEKGLTYATALGVNKIHCMAGLTPQNLEREHAHKTYIENIRYAGEELAKFGKMLLIEPINPFDMPRYFLSSLHEAAGILKEIDLPNVKLQYDFYHMQRIHGNLIANFHKFFDRIGHVQLADVPGRHEPGTGEIHYENIFKALKEARYEGLVGLEYTPKGSSEESFAWLFQLQKGDD